MAPLQINITPALITGLQQDSKRTANVALGNGLRAIVDFLDTHECLHPSLKLQNGSDVYIDVGEVTSRATANTALATFLKNAGLEPREEHVSQGGGMLAPVQLVVPMLDVTIHSGRLVENAASLAGGGASKAPGSELPPQRSARDAELFQAMQAEGLFANTSVIRG